MHELLPYLRLILRRRGRLMAGALLMLITLLAGIGLLSLSGWFITATAVVAALWASGAQTFFDVYIPGGAIRTFALTRTLARYFERLYNHDTVLRLLADLRGAVFAGLGRLHPLMLERLRAGILLNRLTADIDSLDNLYLRLLAPPFVALIAVLTVSGFLAIFLPAAGITVLVTGLVLLLAATVFMAHRGRRSSGQLLQQCEILRVRLIEHFQGLAELCAYGTLAHHRQQTYSDEQTMLDNQHRLGRQIATGNACMTLGIQLLGVVILALGLLAYTQNSITAAVAILMPLSVLALGEAFISLPAAFIHYGHTESAARRLTGELHPDERIIAGHPVDVLPHRFDVKLEHVCYKYAHAENPVLNDVTLTIRAYEQMAIIAESGAGKSTLADLLAGVRWPVSGAIEFDQHDLSGLDLIRLSAVRSYLPQRTDLFEASIADNLRIAAPEATDAKLQEVLHTVGLGDWVAGLADGLDTWIGESGQRISGGEGRRLALARVLLCDAALVLLDEPFSGLDGSTIQQINTNLRDWLRARTVISFAHTAAMVPTVDQVYELREGRLYRQH